jgi:hypothetical protein
LAKTLAIKSHFVKLLSNFINLAFVKEESQARKE